MTFPAPNQTAMSFDKVYTGNFARYENSKEQQAIYAYLLANKWGVTTLQIDTHLRKLGLYVMGGVKTTISELRANKICNPIAKRMKDNENGKRITLWTL
jgi:hypothetical protein